jgi:hypothetical protein
LWGNYQLISEHNEPGNCEGRSDQRGADIPWRGVEILDDPADLKGKSVNVETICICANAMTTSAARKRKTTVKTYIDQIGTLSIRLISVI